MSNSCVRGRFYLIVLTLGLGGGSICTNRHLGVNRLVQLLGQGEGFAAVNQWEFVSRLLTKPASGVLASLRGSTYGREYDSPLRSRRPFRTACWPLCFRWGSCMLCVFSMVNVFVNTLLVWKAAEVLNQPVGDHLRHSLEIVALRKLVVGSG